MSEQQTLPAIIQESKEIPSEIKNVLVLASQYKPKMEIISTKAIAAMQAIQTIEDDDDRQYVNDVLANVRDAYNKIKGYRTEITKPVDEFKSALMEYERPLGDDKGSEYSRLRTLIGAYDQEKINKKKKTEEEAQRKKDRENHLVDIGAAILTNLSNLIMAKVKKGDEDSAAYFKTATLEDFDERAEKYRKMKPTLKTEDYHNCFKVPYKQHLFSEAEYKDITETLAKVETFEKWNEELFRLSTPIVNEWKAKIPELKQNLINLKNAKDESERKRIADEQSAKAKEEEDRRNQSIQQQLAESSSAIANQASLAKLENEFVAQATVQTIGDTGPVKWVLKFTEPKKTMPALSAIIYHCMAHKDFPGIQKRDAKKKMVFDAKGRPEYIEAVQWWINFFLSNCDINIDGTTVYEDAKVIVKK